MITQKDVAKRAGVTVTTVSRMLNNRGSISEKTRKKIMDAMKELDYQPNEIAQSLSKKNHNAIGLIVPSASNYFFCKIVDCVEKSATKYGFKVFLCTSNHEKQKELEYFGMLRANKVAGIILASRTQNLLDEINFESTTVVTVDRQLSPSTPSVCSDNYEGGVMAAAHLLEKGARQPAYLSGSPALDMYSNKRYEGFCDKLKENGITPLVLELSEEQFYHMDYNERIPGFLGENPQIDSVFASNDVIASQVARYCAHNNITVPGKMKIIGYDDIDLAHLYTPSITTIRQPVEDMCRFAVEIIAKREDGVLPVNTMFPVSLIERETT